MLLSHSWKSATGLFLVGFGQLCVCQLAPRPQTIHDKPHVFGQEEQAESERTHPVQRFLGWHYATLAQQDTARWVRPRTSSVMPPASSDSKLAERIVGTQTSPATSFPSAGFASPVKLPTGFLPTAVIQGDFNGDGKMDLAISNGGDNTIYVYQGNGDGTLAVPEVLYTTGQSPVWLAAAQLRVGGHLDLIAVDGDSQEVEVFAGNGNGTFKPSSVVATLSQIPTFVLTGDFNWETRLQIFQGNGDGTFTANGIPYQLPAYDRPVLGGDYRSVGVTDLLDLVGSGIC